MSDLGKIIETLAELPADMVFPHGFAHSHSYRGYYDQLAFEPATNTRAGDMLAAAQSALGKTYTGYKGGDYEMHSWTECWLAEYGDTGEALNIDALVTIARLREQAEALATALEEAGPPVFLQFSASGTYFECCHCQGAGQDRETVVHADECQWLPAAAALRAYREGTK